jgi:uncharacterized protein HemY
MTRDDEINALVEEREFSQAQAIATAWTREHPDDPKPWTTLAFTLKLQHCYGDAAKAAHEAIHRAPSEPGLWMDLGMILYLKQDFDEAANAFGAAIKTGKKLKATYYEDAATLCKSKALLKANKVEEASRILSQIGSSDAEMWLDTHFTYQDLHNEIEKQMLLGVAQPTHRTRKPIGDH